MTFWIFSVQGPGSIGSKPSQFIFNLAHRGGQMNDFGMYACDSEGKEEEKDCSFSQTTVAEDTLPPEEIVLEDDQLTCNENLDTTAQEQEREREHEQGQGGVKSEEPIDSGDGSGNDGEGDVDENDDALHKSKKPRRELPSSIAISNEEEEEVPIPLGARQLEVVNKVSAGKSMFFTGPAGTGKSHVLNVLRTALRKTDLYRNTYFTAPTGIAACNIGGQTIHSWAGVGLGAEDTEKLVGKIKGNKKNKKMWESAKILFIDEVSMLGMDLFDKLCEIGMKLRCDDRPFGGIQVILCGDFFQLPPVRVSSAKRFIFQSKYFKQLIGDNIVELDRVFRQKDDQVFLGMLAEIRLGNISNQTDAALRYNQQQNMNSGSVNPTPQEQESGASPSLQNLNMVTKLFPTNRDADAVNKRELERLPDEAHEFHCIDQGLEKYMFMAEKAFERVPKVLTLKVGTLVVLTKNIDQEIGLVNGTKGVVMAFEEIVPPPTNPNAEKLVPLVEFTIVRNGEESKFL